MTDEISRIGGACVRRRRRRQIAWLLLQLLRGVFTVSDVIEYSVRVQRYGLEYLVGLDYCNAVCLIRSHYARVGYSIFEREKLRLGCSI